MSWLSDLFGGKKTEYKPVDPFDPLQRSVFNQLGSGTLPSYTGQFAAPMNEAEKQAIANQGNLAGTFADWRSRFTPGELNPEVEATEFRNLQNQFYGTGNAPGAKALAEEQFAGTGGYWGSARPEGVMNTYAETVTNPYATGRSTRLQNSYQNALNYGTTASSINQANQTLQSVPRLIEQYGLEQQYADWKRTHMGIDDALNFLNLNTKAYQVEPGKNSNWGGLGNLIGTGVGLIAAPFTGGASIPLASSIMGGIGGLFDNNNVNPQVLDTNYLSSLFNRTPSPTSSLVDDYDRIARERLLEAKLSEGNFKLTNPWSL